MLVSVKQGELRLRLEAPASSTQGNGVVAGDSLASMLDLSMAMAVLSPLPPGRTCATISLTVNMMAATQAGRILATASVERRASSVERLGRNVAFARAALFDPKVQRLLASANSSRPLFEKQAHR